MSTQATPSANTDPVWHLEQFRLGQDRFTAREPMRACGNDEQERGYWAALKAAADADTDVYLRGGNNR